MLRTYDTFSLTFYTHILELDLISLLCVIMQVRSYRKIRFVSLLVTDLLSFNDSLPIFYSLFVL